MLARLSLPLLALTLAALPAQAGELRQWTDKNGVVQLTKKEAVPWRDKSGNKHLTLGKLDPKTKAQIESFMLTIRATGKSELARDVRDYDAHIASAADTYNIPDELVKAVIIAESNYNPMAVSRVGARGLMQLMPGTAAQMAVTDIHDPSQNIHGGTRYLRVLANIFNGDVVKMVAAYNAGPEAVKRAKGIPRYAETQEYVRKVLKLYRIYKGLE